VGTELRRHHLEFDADAAQVLDRAGAADAAVAEGRERLADPFEVGLVEGVLQRRGDGVVVLGGHENVPVVGTDGVLPGDDLRVDGGGVQVGGCFGEEWQVEVAQVELVEGEVVSLGGLFHQPVGGLVGEALGTGRGDDHGQAGGRRVGIP